ncbi:oxaloacetate decarboxylase subunit alpha [Aminipila butyrica]|uniref:Oxaloacetate decarboxylase subunit alpha n=1 Tax=Aminipila butyrica TaxID=433296 RepID=A0A858BTL8_9FIRM|nr:oxaloacetate decarboxylase subunit alpha [Aminipila butyrica]QIB68539.1 oxaloacetate decarboxylase subunit alpha [Aminipila butyrica]
MTKVRITETVLRDGQQSLMATRMRTEEMLPILEVMDSVGYHAIEMWGGATYDACLRFLDEDPWMRLRKIRKQVKNTKLQMLLRGQNLLGYRHYADDLVDEFVNRAINNGIDIIRVFDALNDTRNLQRAIEACNKFGGHAQGAISYTKSPAHDNQVFIQLAKELEQMGAKSICIKDMAGLLDPYNAYELISDIKKVISVPLELHTHATSGLGSMTYMKAVEAGVDIIDTAISPFAEGTSQPATEAMVVAFKGTPYDTGLDLRCLNKIAEHFKPVREKYIAEGLIDTKLMGVDVNTLVYQVPGGMLSNLLSQLKQSNAEDRFEEVLKEVPKVRADLGFPPLVTPTSQIIGTQAVLNVLTGERYKMVPNEVKMIVKGLYGKTTVPISQEIKYKIIGDEEQITCRPADLMEPELDNVKKECARYLEQAEDLMTQALFPKNAEEFFQKRASRIYGMDWDLIDEEAMAYPV